MTSIVAFLMICGVYFAMRSMAGPSSLAINDKVMHAAVFFCFAFLVDLVTSNTPYWKWKGIPLLAYGLFIEICQTLTPTRQFELADLAADAAGIIIYLGVKSLFVKA